MAVSYYYIGESIRVVIVVSVCFVFFRSQLQLNPLLSANLSISWMFFLYILKILLWMFIWTHKIQSTFNISNHFERQNVNQYMYRISTTTVVALRLYNRIQSRVGGCKTIWFCDASANRCLFVYIYLILTQVKLFRLSM